MARAARAKNSRGRSLSTAICTFVQPCRARLCEAFYAQIECYVTANGRSVHRLSERFHPASGYGRRGSFLHSQPLGVDALITAVCLAGLLR